jgi:adenylate cyclase
MAAPRVDRRLAAIMAVDVVGHSRLIGADEAGTLARVKAHRVEFVHPLVAEHHGRMVKLTGDGALVEFASAVDAVECAVAAQAGMAEREAPEPEERRIRYRIGINIGDIVLEDGDIFGDGVNVAARLEGLAEPGGICIARNVYNQVKGKLDLVFQPMGEYRVKNITDPVTVYRVLPGPGGAAKARSFGLASVLRGRRPVTIAASLVVLLVAGAAAAWYALWRPSSQPPATAVAEAQAKPALPLPDKPSIAVLPFRTSLVIPNASGSPTGSPRTSSPTSRASASCSSSPATRPNSTRVRPSICARSRTSSAFSMCWRAASRPMASECASQRSWSMALPVITCGRNGMTAR